MRSELRGGPEPSEPRDAAAGSCDWSRVVTARCPAWATGTVVLHGPDGGVVGYGYLDRATGGVTVDCDPCLLGGVPPAANSPACET